MNWSKLPKTQSKTNTRHLMEKKNDHNKYRCTYWAQLFVLQRVERQLQLRVLILVEVLPALSQLIQRRHGLVVQQHPPCDGYLTAGWRGSRFHKGLLCTLPIQEMLNLFEEYLSPLGVVCWLSSSSPTLATDCSSLLCLATCSCSSW